MDPVVLLFIAIYALMALPVAAAVVNRRHQSADTWRIVGVLLLGLAVEFLDGVGGTPHGLKHYVHVPLTLIMIAPVVLPSGGRRVWIIALLVASLVAIAQSWPEEELLVASIGWFFVGLLAMRRKDLGRVGFALFLYFGVVSPLLALKAVGARWYEPLEGWVWWPINGVQIAAYLILAHSFYVRGKAQMFELHQRPTPRAAS